jgi:hypothetical protein
MACGCAQRRVLARQAMEHARQGNHAMVRQSLSQMTQSIRQDAANIAAKFKSGQIRVKAESIRSAPKHGSN